MAKCDLIQDLIPLYIDDVASEGSRAEVDEHIKICPNCREVLSKMQSGGESIHLSVDKAEIGALKKMKRKLFRKNVWVGCVTFGIATAIVVCTFKFVLLPQTIIPYEDGMFRVEMHNQAYKATHDEYGVLTVSPIADINAKNVEYAPVIDVLHKCKTAGQYATGIRKEENGEVVKYVFFNFTTDKLTEMFDKAPKSYNAFRVADIDVKGYYNDQHEWVDVQQADRIEVYYLSDREIKDIVPDKDYKELANEGKLIYSEYLQ